MLKWVVSLTLCLHVISATFDYVYDEHSLMGKKLLLHIIPHNLRSLKFS